MSLENKKIFEDALNEANGYKVKESCINCGSTNICKTDGKSNNWCFKCAGIEEEEINKPRGSNRILKKKKRKR